VSRVGVVVCLVLAGCGGGRPAAPAVAADTATGSGTTAAAATGPGPAPAPAPRADPLSEASIVADLAWLTAPERRGRGALTEDARAVATWIEAELRAAGYAPTVQPIDRAPGQVNVIAIRDAAAADAAATVVVSAHYDHLGEKDGVVYPGADDNASGVAVALAVARALATDAGRAAAPGRVVFVFTGAEEVGLLGALAYVAAPAVPLADTALAINLDMVGRTLFESAIDRDAALGAIDVDRALAPIAAEAAAGAGLELVTATPSMVKLIGQDWRSDDWVFRDRGVRAVHLSTGLHDDYHKPTDTADKLSRPQLVRITAFLHALVGATAR
jgi:hypothetical protein